MADTLRRGGEERRRKKKQPPAGREGGRVEREVKGDGDVGFITGNTRQSVLRHHWGAGFTLQGRKQGNRKAQ